ncbi:hypothetical protein VYU27_000638 [Nannochloropsis oceanica]
MFHNTYQAGFLSIFYSIGSKPLQIWDSSVQNGYIKRITDEDIQSSVLEIVGCNVSTTFIQCPAEKSKTLGIKLPYLMIVLKNLNKYFTFEVTILDDQNIRRRFRASTFQSCTRVKPFICTMPMRLDDGWNQIQFNLADFTRRAYGTNYVETLRVQVHANCRLRRIYFSDRLYTEEELPAEFKVFLPISQHEKAAMAAAAAALKKDRAGRAIEQQQQQQQQQQEEEEEKDEKKMVVPAAVEAIKLLHRLVGQQGEGELVEQFGGKNGEDAIPVPAGGV